MASVTLQRHATLVKELRLLLDKRDMSCWEIISGVVELLKNYNALDEVQNEQKDPGRLPR
jgi:hypothetical protein